MVGEVVSVHECDYVACSEIDAWLTGKTVCLGQRLARMELKLITSMMLLGFQYSIVDANGARPDILPRPNWNDILLCRPDKGNYYLAYDRTELSL